MPRSVYVRAMCADVCELVFAMCEARAEVQTFAGTGSIGERSTGGAPLQLAGPPRAVPRGDLGGRAAGPSGHVRGRGPALWGRGRSGWCCGGRRGVGAGVAVSRGGGVGAAVLRRSLGGAEWPRGGKSAAQLVFYMQKR